MNSGSGVSGATAAVSGGGVTVTSNDLTSNFVVGGTALTGNDVPAVDFTATAATTGSALTLSDGTHSSTFYYVANNANAGNNTFTSLSDLTTTINSDSLAGKYITASASGSDLTLSNTAGSVTVGGTIGTALGLSGTVDNNYNATLAGLSGSLTVQVGANSAHTISFGTGAGQVSTQAELTTALSGFTDITGSISSSARLRLPRPARLPSRSAVRPRRSARSGSRPARQRRLRRWCPRTRPVQPCKATSTRC